jgi:hypothetical protein
MAQTAVAETGLETKLDPTRLDAKEMRQLACLMTWHKEISSKMVGQKDRILMRVEGNEAPYGNASECSYIVRAELFLSERESDLLGQCFFHGESDKEELAFYKKLFSQVPLLPVSQVTNSKSVNNISVLYVREMLKSARSQ